MTFRVTLTKNAEEDLSYFKIYEQRIIVNSLLNNLKTDADIESKKRSIRSQG
jgi:translation initiation factor 2 beta subunit (eIF-2beta)/eIF-5